MDSPQQEQEGPYNHLYQDSVVGQDLDMAAFRNQGLDSLKLIQEQEKEEKHVALPQQEQENNHKHPYKDGVVEQDQHEGEAMGYPEQESCEDCYEQEDYEGNDCSQDGYASS